MDRDRAICERNELSEKYCHEVKDKAEAQKELSQACKDIETVREERDVARKERTEAIIQRDQLLREYYQARQVTTHCSTPKALKASAHIFSISYSASHFLSVGRPVNQTRLLPKHLYVSSKCHTSCVKERKA